MKENVGPHSMKLSLNDEEDKALRDLVLDLSDTIGVEVNMSSVIRRLIMLAARGGSTKAIDRAILDRFAKIFIDDWDLERWEPRNK